MISDNFKRQIIERIPRELPDTQPYDTNLNHAPKRKDILNQEERLASQKKIRCGDSLFLLV